MPNFFSAKHMFGMVPSKEKRTNVKKTYIFRDWNDHLWSTPTFALGRNFYIRFWLKGLSGFRIWMLPGWKAWAIFFTQNLNVAVFLPQQRFEKYFSEQRHIINYFNQKFMRNLILKVIFLTNIKLSKNCSSFSPHIFLNIPVSVSFQLFYCQLAK